MHRPRCIAGALHGVSGGDGAPSLPFADEMEAVLMCDINTEEVHARRRNMPLMSQRRWDLYKLEAKRGTFGEHHPRLGLEQHHPSSTTLAAASTRLPHTASASLQMPRSPRGHHSSPASSTE